MRFHGIVRIAQILIGDGHAVLPDDLVALELGLLQFFLLLGGIVHGVDRNNLVAGLQAGGCTDRQAVLRITWSERRARYEHEF